MTPYPLVIQEDAPELPHLRCLCLLPHFRCATVVQAIIAKRVEPFCSNLHSHR